MEKVVNRPEPPRGRLMRFEANFVSLKNESALRASLLWVARYHGLAPEANMKKPNRPSPRKAIYSLSLTAVP